MQLNFKPIQIAFVEGSRKSVCRNSGWHITKHFNDNRPHEWLGFVDQEEGRSGLARKLRELRKQGKLKTNV